MTLATLAKSLEGKGVVARSIPFSSYIKQRHIMDLVIVSGCRPDLLIRTLFSINEHMRFEFDNVFVNLDPWPDDQDLEYTEGFILNLYPDAIINKPARPNFCSAVKHLWSQVRSSHAFHTEDDWIWDKNYEIGDLQSSFGMTKFKSEQNGGRHDYGTSPCVITKEFAHEMSAALDINYDPEKQYKIDKNIQDIVARHGVRCLEDSNVIDIGREWRESKGIVKQVIDYQSHWIKE